MPSAGYGKHAARYQGNAQPALFAVVHPIIHEIEAMVIVKSPGGGVVVFLFISSRMSHIQPSCRLTKQFGTPGEGDGRPMAGSMLAAMGAPCRGVGIASPRGPERSVGAASRLDAMAGP